uniref:Uncharacterized protein n=1 Tax=Triticum aestivum TaxID=4565 RepID=A0A080YUL5_WHEAT|nr:unnamed protein product [Triticum aestivum]
MSLIRNNESGGMRPEAKKADNECKFVHGRVAYEKLKPDPVLRNILLSLPIRKLRQPGVELPRSPILCKPNIDAMLHALKLADINPQTTIFFDDSVRNIQAGKQIGMHTVLVGSSERIKGADHALESLHNMKEAFPELWVEAVKDEDVRNSSKVGIETSVIA